MEIKDKHLRCAVKAAQDKKALDLVVLDLRGLATFTDTFLLCSGTSTPQVQAITDEIESRMKEVGQRPSHVEGYQQAEWVLMDYSDLIVHIFSPKSRAFYNLERLWREAPRYDIP